MNKTINNSLWNRLLAQAEEAEYQGLTKIASNLTNQVDKYASAIRSDDQKYHYSSASLKNDIEECCWNAIVRIADFHNTKLDAIEMQKLVDVFAEDLMRSVSIKLGSRSGIGAYEEELPGQEISFEVEED